MSAERARATDGQTERRASAWSEFAQRPEALALLTRIGISAALLVPIRERGVVTGAVVTLGSATPHAHYDAGDVTLVEELGRRVGSAIENESLYAAAQHR